MFLSSCCIVCLCFFGWVGGGRVSNEDNPEMEGQQGRTKEAEQQEDMKWPENTYWSPDSIQCLRKCDSPHPPPDENGKHRQTWEEVGNVLIGLLVPSRSHHIPATT